MTVMMLWLFDPSTHDNGIGDGIDFVCVGEVWVWVQREGGSEVTKPRYVFVLFWNPGTCITRITRITRIPGRSGAGLDNRNVTKSDNSPRGHTHCPRRR